MLNSVLLHVTGTGLSIGSERNTKIMLIPEVNEKERGQTICVETA